ncbi:MAG: mechanosensitive ion channel family protein [Methylomonas sp.]
MDLFNELLKQSFLDNSVLGWLGAAGVAIGIYLGALYGRHLIRSSYQRYAEAEHLGLIKVPLNTIGQTTTFFIFIVAIFSASTTLEMSHKMSIFVKSVLTIALFWQIGVWASTAVLTWTENKRKLSETQNRAAVGTLGIVDFMLRGLIWVMVLLLTLDNLGVNITSLIAGLGIGGIAVALAVQNVLGDLLASISITMDKPFVIGEFVALDNFMGTVEDIGIKSTRLRSLSGEQIIMSNVDLLKGRLRNYGRMVERRALFTLRVPYEVPRTQLVRIPGIVRAIIEAQPGTRFDRCHFATFSPSSLDFETVYYVLSPDYNRYMDIQQAINFGIHEAFEHESIRFAHQAQNPPPHQPSE